MSETARRLAVLEAAHVEAEAALVALKTSWRDEDRQISAQRQLIWARHEQGARDRDLVRVSLGGESLIEAEARATEEAAAKRLAAADAERARVAATNAAAARTQADAQAKADAEAKAKADAAKPTPLAAPKAEDKPKP